jgi:magnesium-transporting ATPase (P-type)
MAGAPLRVIAFAHADMPLEAWQQALAQNPSASANEVLASLLLPGGQGGLDNINLVGALGLEDKVRGKATSALKHTGSAGINVRMVSGDMRRTAEAVALQVGLVTEAEIKEARRAQD